MLTGNLLPDIIWEGKILPVRKGGNIVLNNMKHIRLKRDQSQAMTAESVSVSERGYRCIENGEHEPRLKTAKALERFYGMPIEFLLEPYIDTT